MIPELKEKWTKEFEELVGKPDTLIKQAALEGYLQACIIRHRELIKEKERSFNAGYLSAMGYGPS